MTRDEGTNIIKNRYNIETPYFCVDENELNNNINDLKDALDTYWGKSIIGYSFKTNSLPWLIDYFKNTNCYAEVVSDDEYQLALLAGYDKHKIIYNGPCKSKATFLEAIKNGAIVNIDSQRELLWLSELDERIYEIGVRINFDLEKFCPGESSIGSEGGRFGFCYENGELKKAIDYISTLPQINIRGIHLHCSTRSRSLNVYKTIAMIACEIKRAYNLNLKYIDVGGGFFGGLQDKPQFNDYIKVIANELVKEFNMDNTILIVEPGASLVASPICFVTSVIDFKKTTINNFVVTDGSRNNIDPLMHKSNYFFEIEQIDGTPRGELDKQVISGYTCMENDRLFILKDYSQLLMGDKITYQKVGAYTMCLSPLFIKYFPAVYLKSNDTYIKIHDRWTASDYLNKNS